MYALGEISLTGAPTSIPIGGPASRLDTHGFRDAKDGSTISIDFKNVVMEDRADSTKPITLNGTLSKLVVGQRCS